MDAGEPVLKGLFSKYAAHSIFDISDHGTLIYLPGGVQGAKRRIMVNSGDGSQPTGLPDGPYDNSFSVSGDGSQLCTTRLRHDGTWEVWGGTLDPPRLRRLVAETDADYCYPLLSYDGSMLGCTKISTSINGEEGSYYVVPMDGSKPKKMVTNFSDDQQLDITCFSLDNKRLLATKRDSNQRQKESMLVEIDVETGEITEFLSYLGGATLGQWSPDGKMVAFVTLKTGVPELRIYDPENDQVHTVSHTPVIRHRWSKEADGQLYLIYLSDTQNLFKSMVNMSESGELTIGEPIAFAITPSENMVISKMDNRGNLFSIEKGEDEGEPNHLVVIENWLDSIDAKKK